MAIKVAIAGVKDSDASFEDENFLEKDQQAYDAVIALYEAGAKIENVEDMVARALGDADAAE